MCFRSSNEGKKNEAPGARVNPTTEKASVKPAHRSRVPSTKAKDKAKETPAVRPHADDFSLMRQYEQLYNKIRTFSADFLGGEKPKSADLPKDIENRILRSVSSSTIPKVLNDKTLHRHVIEGLVGITISDLLSQRQHPLDNASVKKPIDQLSASILKFATSKRGTKYVKEDLRAIFQMVITLSQAFQTQSAVFTVTFPPIPETREALDFDAEGMEDKSSGRDALPRVRRVGILVFPGVTKTTKTTKTTIAAHTFLVKTKVVCTDEMERYIGKIST